MRDSIRMLLVSLGVAGTTLMIQWALGLASLQDSQRDPPPWVIVAAD